MKTSKLIFAISLLSVLILSACSPKLSGTWKVDSYKSIVLGKEVMSAQNIGTMTFSGRGKGSKDLKMSIMGTEKNDTSPFTWKLNDNMLTIQSDGSEISKAWIIVDNKAKYKKVQSTDGADQVQVMEISK
jgi:hypothetical protein